MAKTLAQGRKPGSGRKPGKGKTLREGRKPGSGRKRRDGNISNENHLIHSNDTVTSTVNSSRNGSVSNAFTEQDLEALQALNSLNKSSTSPRSTSANTSATNILPSIQMNTDSNSNNMFPNAHNVFLNENTSNNNTENSITTNSGLNIHSSIHMSNSLSNGSTSTNATNGSQTPNGSANIQLPLPIPINNGMYGINPSSNSNVIMNNIPMNIINTPINLNNTSSGNNINISSSSRNNSITVSSSTMNNADLNMNMMMGIPMNINMIPIQTSTTTYIESAKKIKKGDTVFDNKTTGNSVNSVNSKDIFKNLTPNFPKFNRSSTP
ncbi:hypothetical protein TBLA_0B03230 [Henningerozyma blattae CBS 6284]|uniref:Uncharacterized protein n=1 Tax=Henningerozyma blattae (strain ATCC 34711 / CBS 6284 / DSM 70876 / NBRC 10599 / NRRL Y-10934 / UCD 77-7) TaxID=1071380 RepID=I2GYG2_HENB6|nr:hypothetical protein TBLA_0B03230 [Tetrapisispora blattae CBS 6284]CCH59164.1 hypothetical protein TBLA_0B03230 [Tetrapisispora blattae CBS 6284]